MLAIAGRAFPNPESPGLSVGPFMTGSFTHNGKGHLLMRLTGTVKFYNSAKGFGFITPQDGSKDVFVHATAIEAAGLRTLNEGDKVSFVVEDDRRGRGKQAAQLQKA
jgi:cold shock protein